MNKKKETNGYKKSSSKMTTEELAIWLHVNRKAHIFNSKKDYKRNSKHKGQDNSWPIFFAGASPGVRRRIFV